MARAVADARLVVGHVRALIRGNQLRFRAETFGLYYPALPYARPWWQVTPRVAWLFARQSLSYARWAADLVRLRSDSGAEWWAAHGGSPAQWIDPSEDDRPPGR